MRYNGVGNKLEWMEVFEMSKENRFEVVYQETALKSEKTIYVDKETGINYLFIANGFGGGLTPLLDTDGKPVITK